MAIEVLTRRGAVDVTIESIMIPMEVCSTWRRSIIDSTTAKATRTENTTTIPTSAMPRFDPYPNITATDTKTGASTSARLSHGASATRRSVNAARAVALTGRPKNSLI